jgi:hypothetical protein
MANYSTISSKQPELFECFFAFDNKQFEEGKAKINVGDKKIYRATGGLFGTSEGIQKLFNDYEAIDREIAKECTPQDVYNYEWDNHECCISYDDTSTMEIVVRIFGKERAKEVKRRYACVELEAIDI